MATETSPLLAHTGVEDGEVEPPANVSQIVVPSYGLNTEEVQADEAASETQPLTGEGETKRVGARAILQVFLPMAVGVFLVALDSTIVTSIYATIGSEFDRLQSTSWIITGYMLTMTSFTPLYGKLSDIFGRKPCLILAYSAFAAGCLFCGLAGSMNQLIASRALAGIGGGAITTLTTIAMTDVIPMRQRGTWQGAISLVYNGGLSIGAPLGGLFTDKYSWRWAFIVQVPVAIIAIISVSSGLKLPKKDMSNFKSQLKRVDFTGAIALIITVFSLLFGLDRGGNISWGDRAAIMSLATSATFFIIFCLIERCYASEPMIAKGVILDRSMLMIYLSSFVLMNVAYCMPYHVTLYLQAIQGVSPTQVGLVLLPTVVGGILGSFSAGLSIQATGKYYVLSIITLLVSVMGTVLIACTTGPWPYSIAVICTGLGVANFGGVAGGSASFVALITHAGPEMQAIATSVIWTVRSLGGVLGLSLGATLTQNVLRRRLHEGLSGEDVDEIVIRVRESLSYLGTLEPAVRKVVLQSYNDGIQATLWCTVVMGGLAALALVFVKERPIPR